MELYRRRNVEYADEVEKMKGEAAGRKAGAIKKRDKKGRAKPLGKKISPVDKEAAKTSTTLARAVGTNRAYVDAAAKLDNAELEEVRDGKKKMPDVIRERRGRGRRRDGDGENRPLTC